MLHGFDEFWGYLYHLDAMEDPFHRNDPTGPSEQGRPAKHRAQCGERSG